MENFEKYIQKELQKQQEMPDTGVWDHIASRQRPLNWGLKIRHYGVYALPVVAVMIAAAAWWGYAGGSADTPRAVATQTIPGSSPAAALIRPDSTATTPALPLKTAARRTIADADDLPAFIPRNSVPLERARFDAGAGITYRSPESGNTVVIPGGVLVYADGSPVRGAVDLFFREYRSIPDFLAARIPMHYSDRRGEFFFNSGGMFDVRVSQHGEELFLAEGRTYDMLFTPTDELTDASIFHFNDDTGQWEYRIPGQAGVPQGQLPPVVSEETVARENTTAPGERCLPRLIRLPLEEDPALWVQDAIRTGRKLAAGEMQLPVWFTNNPDRGDAFFSDAFDRGDVRMVYEKDNDSRFFPQDFSGVFTELQAFKDCYFVRTGDSLEHIVSAVEQLLRQKTVWTRVEIIPADGPNCLVVLQDSGDGVRLNAQVRRSQEANQRAAFDPQAVFADYRERRTKRLGDLSEQLGHLRHFVRMADMFKTEEEFCMTTNAWLHYFDQNHPAMLHRYDSLTRTSIALDEDAARTAYNGWRRELRKQYMDRMARSMKTARGTLAALGAVLRLNDFGLTNYDQIFQLLYEPDYILAYWQTPEGKPIHPGALTLIDRSTNFYMTPAVPDRLTLMAGRPVDVVVNTAEGRTYLFPASQYSKLDADRNKKTLTLTVEDVTERVKTPHGWVEVLGI